MKKQKKIVNQITKTIYLSIFVKTCLLNYYSIYILDFITISNRHVFYLY